MTDVDDYRDPRDDWEPDPSDQAEYAAEQAEWAHRDEAHGGGECNCPPSPEQVAAERQQAEWMRQHEAEAHGGKPCNCPQYTEPPF